MNLIRVVSASCKETRFGFALTQANSRLWTSQAHEMSPKSLFITNIEGKRNLSPFLLGVFEHFESLVGPRVGFFQPIAGEPFGNGRSKHPRHVELLCSAFNLKDNPSAMFGVERRLCIDLLANGKEDELLDLIFARFEAYASSKRLVVMEGTHQDGPFYTPGSRLVLNAKIAASLDASVLMALDAKSTSAADLVNRLLICKQTIEEQHAQVHGVVLNQVVPPDSLVSLKKEVAGQLQGRGIKLFGALPHSAVLASARLDEIQLALNAQTLCSHSRPDAAVDKVVVGSGTLDRTLEELSAGGQQGRTLVLCDASRSDLVLGLTAAHGSRAGPHPAALLLTGGVTTSSHHVNKVLQGGRLEGSQLPLLASQLDSWEASQRISGVTPDILPSSARKIEEAKALVAEHVDFEALDAAMDNQEESAVTPKKFMRHINKICQQQPQSIVLPEGLEPRILRAAAEVTRKGLARVTLLGEPLAVRAEASRIGADVSQCEILDHCTSDRLPEYAALLVEKRKHKGMTLERARDALADPNFFGTLMAASGHAGGMVSGSTSTTANTIRPALQILKTKSSLVSSVFFMCLPTKVLVYGDCAVNTNPNSEELAKIGITSAESAAAFGIEPRVAFLSYSTLGSGSGEGVEKVIKAVEIAREMRPDLMIEGPIQVVPYLQYDAAVDPVVAKSKVKGDSKVAGRATVLIVPDLNVGNIVYKAVQQATGAVAIGPILQGLTKPVNDLSRGCTVADIVNTITCTEVQSAAVRSAN